VILSLMAISIIQVNAYTKETYMIGQYQQKVSQLQEETSYLEINLSKANSLDNLAQHADKFVKAEKIEYIKLLGETALAK
jgi:hypothetical protein